MDKIAFVFAGQGAQSVGMGKDIYETHNAAKVIFDLAGDQIKEFCFLGPKEDLNQTINAQPCLFTMDLACANVLNDKGIFAQGVAGFSLGEIPALAYSGLMGVEQALDFVHFRAKVMHECALIYPGSMFAVLKLSDNEVQEICQSLNQAYPVNYNCPGQIVVACNEKINEQLKNKVLSKGGKILKLTVSGAFHSPFMNEASEKVVEYLETQQFKSMKIPIFANATAKIYDHPKELLSKQINSPVLWQKTIENMIKDKYNIFIEVGMGKTLTGLIKKINNNVKAYNVCDNSSLNYIINEVQNA